MSEVTHRGRTIRTTKPLVAETFGVTITPPSDLCTVDDVKAFLKKTDDGDDAILQTLVTAASDAITLYCRRQFTPDATNPRSHRFRSTHRIVDLAPYDLQTAATVTLNPQTSSPLTLTAWTDYELLPIDSDDVLGTYFLLQLRRHIRCHPHYVVDIDGTWGAAAIPPIVNQAAYVTTAEWFRAKVAGFSTRFNDDGVHVAPAPLPTMVCGWLERIARYPLQ